MIRKDGREFLLKGIVEQFMPDPTQEDEQFGATDLGDDGLLLRGERGGWVPGRRTHGEAFLVSFSQLAVHDHTGLTTFGPAR